MMDSSEQQLVTSALPGSKIESTTIARLYTSNGDQWTYTGKMGALALVSTNGSYYFKIVDLKSRQILFDQELYENMDYAHPVGFFHYFEIENCVAGFSFANENEANTFCSQVLNVVRRLGSMGGAPPPPSSPMPSSSRPSSMMAPMSPQSSSASLTSNPSSGQLTTANWKPVNIESNQPVKLTKEQEKAKKKEDKKRKKKDPSELVIGEPTNFRHESSIGWNPNSGFEIRNIPPAWRKMFKDAGIKKKDLKNEETAAFIMDFMAKNSDDSGAPIPGSGGSNRPPPPPPGGKDRAPPPPPGSFGGGAPPPPPPGGKDRAPPPPPGSYGAPPPPPAPGAPPPPPPPPAPGAPPPPPAPGAPPPPSFERSAPSSPSPSVGGGGGRGDLLAAIRGGAALKSVDYDRPAEVVTEAPSGLAATLAAAMESRRGAIKRDDEEQNEEEEEWSDEDWE